MHPFLDDLKFAAFAHRGGALEAVENTMEAFAHAVDLGFYYIETDVQLTSDGVVVVFHDDHLKRLTGTEGTVADHDWRSLCNLTVHGEGRIPRLEEVLDAWPDVRFNIDAKTDDVVEPLCRLAKGYGPDRLCLASEFDARLAHIRGALGAAVCTAGATRETALFILPALAGLPSRQAVADCFQVPPRFYGIPAVTRQTLRRASGAGKHVHVWTIDDEAEMNRLIDLGVQGIMTDRPTLLRGVLNRRGLWS